MQERVELCRKHIQSSIQWKGEKVAGREMRKHYTLYFKGYPHFKSYRMRLVTVETFDEIEQIFTEMLANFE